MFTKRLAAGIVFALSLGFALWLLSPAWMIGATVAPKPADADEMDFKGKVIVIRFSFPLFLDPLALEGAKVRKLGDKFFLTGKGFALRDEGHAIGEKIVWHDLKEISQIIECENMDTAKKTLKAIPPVGPLPLGFRPPPPLPESGSIPQKKLNLALASDPAELPKDVYEIETRQFAMPLGGKSDDRAKIEKILLFVSEDQGKNWKHKKGYKPSDRQATFTAPRDGQYWFAVQVVLKDGNREPAELDDLAPQMKVYVNSERRTLKTQKSYEELQREVEQLRGTVEQLQKKIKQLESGHQPK
jgi:hypothetical protein